MGKSTGGAFVPTADYTTTGNWTTSGTITNSGAVTNTGAVVNSGTVTNSGGNPITTTNVGTVAASTVTAVEYGSGPFHQTVLTLTAVAVAISDTHVGGGTKIYTFPEGIITVLGASAKTITPTTTSTIASTLKASKTLSVGVGSVVTATQDSGTLVTTEQDIVNAFSATSSATINVAGTAGNGYLSATTSLKYDGHTTAQPIYLNCGVPTAGDIDADATTTWTGTVTITWVYDGDY